MRNFTLSVFLLISLWTTAQNRFVRGSVKDSENHQPIAFCTVALLNSPVGTSADAEGNFKISIPSNPSLRIIVSMVGYKTDTIKITPATGEYMVYLSPLQSAIDEVVVTGVSKATLLRENPVAISIISPKAIEQTTESNIIDVLVKNVPGLNAVKTGPNISKPFIRGLGYNRVLTLYDGIRQEGQQWGDEHGIEVDGYNIERAEVIKGPSSLMYGSDALAGVVSLFPAMPKQTNGKIHGRYFSEYQSNNGLIGNGFRLVYAGQHWSYALRGSYRLAKNYMNSIDGRVYNTGFQETNISALVAYASKKGYSNLNFTIYDNFQGIPDGSRDSLTRKFTKQVDESWSDNIKNRPLVSDSELNSYRQSPLHQHIQHFRIYSNNRYGFRKGDVDISLALQQNIRREYNHPTDPQQAGMYVLLNTVNYGLRYNSPSSLPIDISIGINGMYQNNTNKNATDFPIPNYNLFDEGTYLFAKWKNKRWTISGGVRYDFRHISGDDFYTKKDASTGFNRQVTDDTSAYLQFPDFKKTFGGISFSGGATFRISEHIGIKANIARGYRAPNITEFASNGLDPGAHIVYLGNRNFIPEFSLQEDIGLNGNLDDVTFSVSVFNNNIENYIYLSKLVDANGNPVVIVAGNNTYQYQQAAAQLYGMEASVDLHPKIIKGFSFNNNFSITYGFNRKPAYQNKGINGAYLPFIPPFKLISSFSQNIKTKSKRIPAFNFKAETDFSGAQNNYLALDNTETATPSFLLFNLGAGIDIGYAKNSTIQLQTQVNNLFDAVYQSNLSRLKYFEYYTQSPNGHLGIYGMGRNICVKLIVPL